MDDCGTTIAGRWIIKGTNFPMWLNGKRNDPSITYSIVSRKPLKLSDSVEYTNKKGKIRSINGLDTRNHNGFQWRGNGILKLLTSQWQIEKVDNGILIIRFKRSIVTPAGIDVLVRGENIKVDDIPGHLLKNLNYYGLSADDYRSLIWI